MTGTVILSHGFESGPAATKTTAMAAAAQAHGWQTLCPDYREHDVNGLGPAVDPRCRQLRALCDGVDGPLVLAGSSMGAFVSGLVSREVACIGLFLLAVPVRMPDHAEPFDLRPGIPTTLVHGHDDELCPADSVWALAHRRKLDLMVVDDSHRLAGHVDWIAAQFGLFLERLQS